MTILSRLGKKNKESSHYQRKYEEIEADKGVNILGTGMVRGKLEEKEQYYEDVRSKITVQDKKRISDIAKVSVSIYDVFTKMEKTGIPLDYLVALGLVEEVDVESYQNIKLKGLTGDILNISELEKVDDTLRMQVLGQANRIPELKYSLGEEDTGFGKMGEHTYDEEENVREEGYKEQEEVKSTGDVEKLEEEGKKGKEEGELGSLKQLAEELRRKKEKEEREREEQKRKEEEERQRVIEEDKRRKEEELLRQEELIRKQKEARRREKEAELLRIEEERRKKEEKERQKKLEEEKKEREEQRKKEEQRREKERIRNTREVYIIGDNNLLPVVEGYNIKEVKGMTELMEYTSSQRNLLIITQQIPKEMQQELIKWLRSVMEGSKKYRIATLKDSAVKHELIESTVEITKESLDTYYKEFKDEDYEEKDVEGFYDISEFLKW